MFATADLAARLDRAEMEFCAGIAGLVAASEPQLRSFVQPVAGGAAIYAGPDSPTNKLIGAGFGQVPDDATMAAIEAAYAERGAPFQAEVSTLAEPDFPRLLIARGYYLQGYENLLGRALVASEIAGLPGEVSVDLVPGDPAALASWLDVLVTGFASPDIGGVGGDVQHGREVLERWCRYTASLPGLRAYIARIDGVVAGAGALRSHAGVAMLCGASTLPAWRRRGIQTALLRARMLDAARHGCDVAMITVQPASKSQQNVQREGFALLCSRALLVRNCR
jgi:GNAT superfamily N-acetyltransferase